MQNPHGTTFGVGGYLGQDMKRIIGQTALAFHITGLVITIPGGQESLPFTLQALIGHIQSHMAVENFTMLKTSLVNTQTITMQPSSICIVVLHQELSLK